MKYNINWGAFLLPIFFVLNIWGTNKTLERLYGQFYEEPAKKNYEKNLGENIFKKIYHLPSSGKGRFYNQLKLNINNSFIDKKKYGYVYIEVKENTKFAMVVAGIKEGFLKINGSQKGKIITDSYFNPVIISVWLKRGIYFISFRIDKKISDNQDIIVLSDKVLKISNNKAFRRYSRSSVSIEKQQLINKYNVKIIEKLYEVRCFPFSDEKQKDVYISLLSEKFTCDKKNETIIELLHCTKDKKSRTKLKNYGFSEDDILWWEDYLKNGMRCINEK